jgi:wyosine [tRNA(Phe)-imidazoG37] synthetase (radical SAM superfamily)
MLKIAFGPVPSRRLGQSLGINNIPPKICSYACIYCQLGRTIRMQIERDSFYQPGDVLRAAREKVNQTRARGEAIDFLTLVPDGEPTLDIHLEQILTELRELGIPLAVISNASLIDQEEVRRALKRADWVSLKVDSVRPDTWHAVDRPHGSLHLDRILQGICSFADEFDGVLTTETMLVRGVNDHEDEVRELARFLAHVGPDIAYLAVPTRPPAESWVEASLETEIHRAFQILSEVLNRVECLLGYEGNAFASSGDAEADLLSITAVHPMREDAVVQLLADSDSGWDLVDRLIQRRDLVELNYRGKRFYLRRVAIS